MLDATVLRTVSELEALRDEWAELLSRSSNNESTMSPLWVLNWWQVYGAHDGRELCVLILRRGQRLVGLAPLCRRKIMHLSMMPMIRIELMGSGEREEDETCSEYINVIAEAGEEQNVAAGFGEALHGGLLGTWDHVCLTALSGENVMVPLLARSLGMAARYRVLGGAPFATLPESWDAYLANMSSSRRALVRKSLRAWEKWAKEPPKLKRVETEDQLEHGIEILTQLHGQRWQESGHVGAFHSPLFNAFHRKTMLDLLRKDSLWLCWLEVEGKPVAALYNIVWENQVRFYQSGRVVDVPKKIRPGIVIHACAIQEAISAGYSHYDFLNGSTRYKMQLATNVRPVIELSVTRASQGARLRDLGDRGVSLGRSARNLLRSRLS